MGPLVEEAMRADSGALKIAIDCSIDQFRPRQMNDKVVNASRRLLSQYQNALCCIFSPRKLFT